MHQATQGVFVFAKGGGVVEVWGLLLAMDTDLAILRVGHHAITAPGTKGAGEWLDGIQAIGAYGQGGDVREGGVTETAVGGEQRGEEALGDKAKRSRHLSLSLACAIGAG